jgi:Acetyltransferase (GNAT) domain
MNGTPPARFGTIDDVPEDRWRAAVGNRFPCSPEWLRMLEANGFALARRYTLVSVSGEEGAICCYLVDEKSHIRFQPLGLLTSEEVVEPWLGCLSPAEREAAGEALSQAAGIPIGRAAVSVSPFSYTPGLVGAAPEVVRELIAELERAAADWDCAPTAVLYVDGRDKLLRDALTEAGYIGWITGATAQLPIEWPSLEGYIQSRESRNRRKTIRYELARFDAAGITVGTSLLPADTSDLARLTALHEQKHGHGYHPEFEDMVLQNYRKHLGDNCFIVTGEREGRLVGFLLVLRDRDIWRPGLSGWDESLTTPTEFIYFGLGYYRLIELAIREGATTIDYGLEAYDAKVRRGCVLQPLWCYVKVPREYRDTVSAAAAMHVRGVSARARQWPPRATGSLT